jgi:hypothetical protein
MEYWSTGIMMRRWNNNEEIERWSSGVLGRASVFMPILQHSITPPIHFWEVAPWVL